MSRAPASSRSPLRLLLLGAALLWVVAPLLLGGLITVMVRAHNGGGIGLGLGVLFAIWALVALLVLLAGFAALVAAVVAWWRRRTDRPVVRTDRTEDVDEPGEWDRDPEQGSEPQE